MSVSTKTAVSVAEMARMVGLSRARFYQLIGSAFPHPAYLVLNRRPIYDELAQQVCLEVRRRNCGIDGTPILFYSRRPSIGPSPKKRSSTAQTNDHSDLIESLKGLGLIVSPGQVDATLKELFPIGTHGVDQGEFVRRVFVNLKTKGV